MKPQCEHCGLCIADPMCSPGRVILRNSWKNTNLCENCCSFFSLKPCFTCSDENNIYWFDTTVGGGVISEVSLSVGIVISQMFFQE